MERTVEIPQGVSIEVDKFKLKVTGPKGSLEKDFYNPMFSREISVRKDGDKFVVAWDTKKKKVRAMVGTIEAHAKNMIGGVTKGYDAKMKMVYMHFPFTVKVTGREILVSNFLGEKTPRKTKVVGDCKVEVKGDEIVVTGINKEDVGQTACNMERATKIRSRDRRVFQDGIFWLK